MWILAPWGPQQWLLTLALHGRLYRALQSKLYATRNLCMRDFLKLHRNWDAYMGVQKERKSTFLTAFEQREKEARSLFVHIIDISVVSECLCHLRAQYPIKSPDICISQYDFTYWPPNFNTGVAVLLALLALKAIQTVLLQLKIIPCDSAYLDVCQAYATKLFVWRLRLKVQEAQPLQSWNWVVNT